MASSPRPRVKACGAEVLAKLKDPRSEATLLELARGDDAFTKRHAIVGLGFLQCRAAVPIIVPCLKEDDHGMQRAGVEALARIQDPAALEPLRALRKSASKKLLPIVEKAIARLERI